ncbi:unnamed protein product, partial [Prorocentrum cordatum]
HYADTMASKKGTQPIHIDTGCMATIEGARYGEREVLRVLDDHDGSSDDLAIFDAK